MARRQSSDGEASEQIAVAYDEKVDDAREALQAAEARVEVSERRRASPPRTWSTRRSSAAATGRSTTRPMPVTTRSWRCC